MTMTIDQLKEAFAAGAQIQIRIDWLNNPSTWEDIDDPAFDYFADRYRVKPKENDK